MAHKRKPAAQNGFVLHLGDRGRLVLPSRLRKQLGWKTGEELVLIVEDDIGYARLLQEQFVARGLTAVRAADAETAERLLKDGMKPRAVEPAILSAAEERLPSRSSARA